MNSNCRRWAVAAIAGLAIPTVCGAFMLFQGDGSDEPGFVPPIQGAPPPPPPAHMASGETYIPYPGPPVVPQARSEKKNPPTPPVMFTKIKSEHGPLDWASRPNDLNNLLKSMKGMMDVDFSMEAKSLAELDTNPEKNPILYRTGHFRITHTPEERRRLRDYLINGGMIIYDAGAGSKPFYDSACAEMRAIFPETPLMRLGPDHPIFHAYYDINRAEYRSGVRAAGYREDTPWMEGVTINCRTVAVISRWGMGIGWDALNDDNLQGYSVDCARKLGVNLMSYATAQRAWARQIAQSLQFTDSETVSAGKMAIAQVVYDGEWRTRHKGLSILLKQFNLKTEVPVKFGLAELKLTDPKIFDSPLLYLTGHEDFRFSAAEAQNLREYLRKGGCVLAEACCGRAAFDVAFRREMKKVMPEGTLKPLPAGDQIFTLPNRIDALSVTPGLAAQAANRSRIEPRIEALDVNGHYGVIYSPFGLAGGWELSPNPYGRAYDEAGSLALGINVLMYAITQ